MEQYVIRGGEEGFARLRSLAALRLPDTRALFDRVGVREGWTCADLGAGSGDITAEIARRVGPSGSVTGFDMDTVKLGLARTAVADAGLGTVRFEVADLREWSAPAQYDLVYCGLVLQHLRNPGDLIRRMWEAVRPGGLLVVEDADFDGMFCHPPSGAFDFYAERYSAVLRSQGGDPAMGRKVFGLFLDAGIPNPETKLVQRAETGEVGKSMAPWTLDATADAIVAQGLAARVEIEQSLAELRAYVSDPTTIVGDPRLFQVWASKARTISG